MGQLMIHMFDETGFMVVSLGTWWRATCIAPPVGEISKLFLFFTETLAA